jgi:tetrahydromethanopterin S-methyltransferase subunit G
MLLGSEVILRLGPKLGEPLGEDLGILLGFELVLALGKRLGETLGMSLGIMLGEVLVLGGFVLVGEGSFGGAGKGIKPGGWHGASQ